MGIQRTGCDGEELYRAESADPKCFEMSKCPPTPIVSRVPLWFPVSLRVSRRRFSRNFGALLASRWRHPRSAAHRGYASTTAFLHHRLRKSRHSMH